MMIDEYSILKKKQRKNAFAATALLISIAIALLVMVGAVLILGKVNDKDRIAPRENGSGSAVATNSNDGSCEGLSREIVFNENIKTVKEAAISYFTNSRLPKELNETKKITLREMKDKKLVLNVRDASANTCDGNKSYVEVTKGNNEYVMKVFLSCSDIEDYIIVHLGCYDYCDKDVCEKEVEPEKVYEYEYKKSTSCTMSDWSSWGAWKTVREKTSNLKKEDTKTETIKKDTVYKYDASVKATTYNCNNYPGYTLSGVKCIKQTTVAATKTKDTYNCNSYSGYTLSGTKCVKQVTTRDTKDATKNEPTYSCPSGYTRSVITYTVKSGDTINSVASANYISVSALKLANKLTSNSITVGQKLTIPVEYQTRCYKDVIKNDTPKPAKAIYNTTYINGTCYENICSTDFIPSCVNGICKMEEVRTCDKVSRTCRKPKQEFSHYDCSDYPGYNPVGDQCIRTYTDREYVNANKNTDTYNCNSYSGYTLSGTKCYKDIKTTDEKTATVVKGVYQCNTSDGYTLSGTNCVKVLIKEADKNKPEYYCSMSDYTLTKDNKCVKTVTTGQKVTYYRYSTRTCDGGKTYTKWSLDTNDTKLLDDGYKKTGNKREYKGIIEK